MHVVGCTMPAFRSMTGYANLFARYIRSLAINSGYSNAGSNNCEGTLGCGVILKETDSFGPTFNDIGGGWYDSYFTHLTPLHLRRARYAMERTNKYIRVWFWSRNDPSVPADVRIGGPAVNTNTWVRICRRSVIMSIRLNFGLRGL
jgi:hypothetical protein